MGILTREQTGEHFVLHSETIIGRSRSCTLQLDDPLSSSSHARLAWGQSGWEIRDLNSRNGTLANGVAISGNVLLQEGARLGFGSGQDIWILTSAHPPTILAMDSESAQIVHGVGELLTLPDEETPEVTIYRDEQSGWCAESREEKLPVQDGDLIQVGGRTWRLGLPNRQVLTETLDLETQPPMLFNSQLRFEVTLDEEHVKIYISTDSKEQDLGSRAHHYMLLLLARRRLADAAEGDLKPSAHGWIYQNELMQMLGVDLNRFNVHVYRARQRFIEIGLEDGAQIIERRPDTRQLRIGVSSLSIRTI